CPGLPPQLAKTRDLGTRVPGHYPANFRLYNCGGNQCCQALLDPCNGRSWACCACSCGARCWRPSRRRTAPSAEQCTTAAAPLDLTKKSWPITTEPTASKRRLQTLPGITGLPDFSPVRTR